MTVTRRSIFVALGMLWSTLSWAEEIELKLSADSECQLFRTGQASEIIKLEYPIELKSQSEASTSVLKCRLSWEPLLPKFKWIEGGDLVVTGIYTGEQASSSKIRGKNRLLGSGLNPDFDVKEIPNGEFELTWDLAKPEDSCSMDTKIISTLTYIYRSQEDLSELKILGMKLKNIKIEPCLEEEKNEKIYQ